MLYTVQRPPVICKIDELVPSCLMRTAAACFDLDDKRHYMGASTNDVLAYHCRWSSSPPSAYGYLLPNKLKEHSQRELSQRHGFLTLMHVCIYVLQLS